MSRLHWHFLASGKNEKEKASSADGRRQPSSIIIFALCPINTTHTSKGMSDEDDGSDCGPSLPAGVLRSRGGWAGDSLEIGKIN